MTNKGPLDPRYRINVPPSTRVMIKEEGTPDLVPCRVKEIITKDAMHEMGIMVLCEDGHMGRVRHIGTEASYMQPLGLITGLEAKLRKLIVDELSRDCPEWWDVRIQPKIRERVAEQMERKYNLPNQTPRHNPIEEIYFSDLATIILAKKNWKECFAEIFHDGIALRVKLSELSMCRNTLAHSKKPTKHMERKIRVYYDDIIPLVEKHYRQGRKSK